MESFFVFSIQKSHNGGQQNTKMNMSEHTSKIKFGTDGWRAIIAEDFTFANVGLVTKAIVTYLHNVYDQSKPLLISYDPRFLADEFALYAAQLSESLGRKTLLTIRDTPTPVIAHAATDIPSAGALQFTASHNPAYYCGLKYIPPYGGPANEEITAAIALHSESFFSTGYIAPSRPELTNQEVKHFDPRPAYEKALLGLVDLDAILKSGLKIGTDAMNGAGRGYLSQLLGAKVALGEERDPLFRGSLPEPKASCLLELTANIVAHKLDLGLANDGDADRFGIIDAEGLYYTPNQIIVILARYLHEQRGLKGAIVRTVSTTQMLDRLAAHYGLPLVETKVGFKYICEVMLTQPVLIGGEESGGLSILGHIPEKDGILACLLVAEAMAKTGKTLNQLWKEAVALCNYDPQAKRLDLHVEDRVKALFSAELKKLGESHGNFAGLQVAALSSVDGIKLTLADGSWVLARASGTEPIMRVYLETSSPEQLTALENAAKSLLARTEENMKLRS